ncbi:MAG: Phytoene synthase [Ignavibacteriae bacterium]|nr:MAG: Phytoene synthase [Ignavibacteriota bacterium]
MGFELTNILDQGYSSSFKLSFLVLPKVQRQAIMTIYDFCRATDDIVDGDLEQNKKVLYIRHWRIELGKALKGESKYALLNKLTETAKKFNIPVQHFYDLIRGVEMDLYKNRYKNFQELEEYCRLVASSVGLMVIKIFTEENERIIKYAENLGIALQLTNILRDIKLDAKLNRIYVPVEDLQKFNYTEADLIQGIYNDNFFSLMEYETKRAEEYYERARNILKPEDKIKLLAPKIMERIYFRTLKKIKKNNYKVFDKTIRLSIFMKMLIAIKYFVKIKILKMA